MAAALAASLSAQDNNDNTNNTYNNNNTSTYHDTPISPSPAAVVREGRVTRVNMSYTELTASVQSSVTLMQEMVAASATPVRSIVYYSVV